MSIKLWNWDLNWKNIQTFEGHSHYVMYLAFNPKDPNTFASACLDRTVKIWSLGSSTPNFTLEAHESKGVNFVEYYPQSDKPYLITTSDDRTIRVWDYQTKSCVATLEGHTNNVSFALFHPELPVIISGSEDTTIKVWNANTYKLEQTLNYGLERAWCAACRPGSNLMALGFDAGNVVIQLGNEEPAISMDPNGRLVWSKHSEVYSSVVKSTDTKDGELLTLTQKELGSVEVYATQLVHSPNGRFVAVCGDGEYIIYTALAWRNKSFGTALDFAWAHDSNEYAVRDSSGVRTFKNFKERPVGHLNVPFSAERLFGGALLGIKGPGFIAFYDWDSGVLVQRVDVEVAHVAWSDNGDLVAVAGDDALYVLRYDRELFTTAIQAESPEDGVDDAFQVVHDIPDSVQTGKWVGDCFIYTTKSNRLNYLVGGHVYTITHFDAHMYLLGYIPRDNRVYLADKDVAITSYHLSLAVVEYQTVVLRGDMEYAAELLDTIPQNERNKVARFLESQGHEELALEISQDPEHRFDLAVSLGKLSIAEDIAKGSANPHWNKSLGDAALAAWNISLAERCFRQANDLESLLLIYSSTGNRSAAKEIANLAEESAKYNVAFDARWFVGDTTGCVDLLNKSGRHSEAALFALTYGGDVANSVAQWKNSLVKDGREKTAAAISEPLESPKVAEKSVEKEKPKDNDTAAQVKTSEEPVEGDVEEKSEEGQEEKAIEIVASVEVN